MLCMASDSGPVDDALGGAGGGGIAAGGAGLRLRPVYDSRLHERSPGDPAGDRQRFLRQPRAVHLRRSKQGCIDGYLCAARFVERLEPDRQGIRQGPVGLSGAARERRGDDSSATAGGYPRGSDLRAPHRPLCQRLVRPSGAFGGCGIRSYPRNDDGISPDAA